MARENAFGSRKTSASSNRPTSSSSRPTSSALRSRVTSPAKTSARGRQPSSRLFVRVTRQNSKRLSRMTSLSNTATFHERAKVILSKPSDERDTQELNLLETWFRKKSKLFEKLNRSKFDLDLSVNATFATRASCRCSSGRRQALRISRSSKRLRHHPTRHRGKQVRTRSYLHLVTQQY